MTKNITKILTKTDERVTIVGEDKGWLTVRVMGTKDEKRVRSSQLRDLTDAEKTERGQTRVARPAGLVGGEKTAKIGDAVVKLDHYFVSDVKTTSGRRRIDSNDEVAVMVRELDLDGVYKVAAEKLGVTQKSLHDRYDALNQGMQRMNLTNRIRGAIAAAARPAKVPKAVKAMKADGEKKEAAKKAPAAKKAATKRQTPKAQISAAAAAGEAANVS